MRTIEDILRSNELNTYVMSCYGSKDELFKRMREDIRILCGQIEPLVRQGAVQPVQTAGQTCHNCLFNCREYFGDNSDIKTETCYNNKSLMNGKSVDSAYKNKFYCSEWKLEQR